MKTDKELLELAAKAHGFIDDQADESDAHGLHRNGQGIYYVIHKHGWYNWRPLTDDGDALRLAVKLGIDVAKAVVLYWDKTSTDPYAATRRAIVRAAAAMGEAMQ